MTLNISLKEHANDPQPNPTVAHVQARLIGKGYSCGPSGADGHFGYYSDKGARRFQTHIGLNPDGVVGPKTLAALDATIAYSSINSDDFVNKAYSLVTTGIDGTRPRYVFGAEVANLTNPSPDYIDCSELVQWAVFQITHNTWVDGSWNQAGHCRIISVDQAARTKGALLFVSSNGHTSGVHHVAISRGLGRSVAHGTAEARSSTLGCGSWPIGNRFSFGGLVPILHY